MRWPSVALGEVATLDRHVVAPHDIRAGTYYVGLENVRRGGQLTDVATTVEGQIQSAKHRFGPHHVLYGKLRPNLAKFARPDFSGVCSTDILPISPGERLDRDYLAHFPSTPETVAWATSRASGANLPRLSPGQLAECALPLPPMQEQRRIAAVLDRADALRAQRLRSSVLVEQLGRSAFLQAFGDPRANPRNWPIQSLGELSRVIRGASPRPAGDPRYFGGSIPWLKISEVTASRSSHVSMIKEGVTEAGRQRSVLLRAGTLILTNSATVGIPKFLAFDACIHDGFLALLDIDESIHPLYLYYLLLISREHVSSMAPEGTQKNLNTGLAKRISVPVPPRSAQDAFASLLGTLDSSQVAMQRHLDELDSLGGVLRHRAFRGEL